MRGSVDHLTSVPVFVALRVSLIRQSPVLVLEMESTYVIHLLSPDEARGTAKVRLPLLEVEVVHSTLHSLVLAST